MTNHLPKAVISDLDGTLAIATQRRYHDFTKVYTDTPDTIVRDFLQHLSSSGYLLLFSTGRVESCRQASHAWIEDVANLPVELLVMRGDDDLAPDPELKRQLYQRHIAGKYAVDLVLEDKRSVVDMWRQEGLRCYEVANNEK